VFVWVAVTLAPGTTAPLGSATTPEIWALAISWANNRPGPPSTAKISKTAPKKFPLTLNRSGLMIFSFSTVADVHTRPDQQQGKNANFLMFHLVKLSC
jgi:hypothetical protein